MMKDYLKYKQWLEKKEGDYTTLMCYESNLYSKKTWWIDSGTTIHVINIMQDFLNLRRLTGNEEGFRKWDAFTH